MSIRNSDCDKAALRRQMNRDSLPGTIILSALVLGIVLASTTLYLSGLDAAASVALH